MHDRGAENEAPCVRKVALDGIVFFFAPASIPRQEKANKRRGHICFVDFFFGSVLRAAREKRSQGMKGRRLGP